jgi:hypothetical protein
MRKPHPLHLLFLAAVPTGVIGQAPQVVKPPIAQAWIDVATYAGMGMPAGGGNPMASIGALFGGSGGPGGDNSFGRTQTGATGRWVDVTLATSANPALAEGAQAVPAGSKLAPRLQLVTPDRAPPPPPSDETPDVQDIERPRGKLSLYWGCGETVRPGQPRTIDLANPIPADLAQVLQSRRATQRGAHSAAGRPQWPSKVDRRMVPDDASLVGEHAFSGQGVPQGFKFNIGPSQDIMPPIELAQSEGATATLLEWRAQPNARAYFIAAMGSRPNGNEVVMWTSSELPDMGQGLIDYQTNAAVDRWLRDRVLLPPTTTRCAIPKGILGEGGMLRMIAYGSEINVVHPPRPSDPKVAWEPQWAAKVRVKSVYQGMVGVDMSGMPGAQRGRAMAPETAPAEGEAQKKDEKKPGPLDVLRGILGK